MSEISTEIELGTQYILNDSEFILEPSELRTDDLNDVIYMDGHQAFLVNGQLLQNSGETPTLVLQEGEDINQYLINGDKGELLLANIENETINETQENQHIIQYVDEDGNITEPQEILYINENGDPITQENLHQYKLAELMETGNSLPVTEDELAAIIDSDSLSQQPNDDNSVMELNASDWYQFAVVQDQDSQYEIQSSEDSNQDFSALNINSPVDVSAITGKDHMTGQVVTLESYMDRIQKKIKSTPINSNYWKKPKHNLNAFLNKKFNLGVTLGGKRLVGKIVHVGTKDESTTNEIVPDTITQINEVQDNQIEPHQECSLDWIKSMTGKLTPPKSNTQMLYQTKLLSKKSDQFQRISATLSNLMTKEDVNKQLIEKSLHIKIIDKFCDNTKKGTQNVCFISGYMESKIVYSGTDSLEEIWTFVPDTLTTESVRSQVNKKSQIKYADVINLIIITTHQENMRFVKVILDPKSHTCGTCNKTFTKNQNLILHLNEKHKQCEYCKYEFETAESLMQHKEIHVKTGEMKICTIGSCKKIFLTEPAFRSHMAVHKLEAFKCTICPYSGVNEVDLKIHSQTHPNNCDICGVIFINKNELNAHKRNHPKEQPLKANFFACEICQRTFSRQSNLQRHIDIHKGADQVFRCTICGCSYHYVSSLTRHIVQNHKVRRKSDLKSLEDSNVALVF